MAKRKILGKETVPQYVKDSWPLLVDLAIGKTVKIRDKDYKTKNTTVVHRIGGRRDNQAGYDMLERAIYRCGEDLKDDSCLSEYELPQNLTASLNKDQRKELARFLLSKYYRTIEGSE